MLDQSAIIEKIKDINRDYQKKFDDFHDKTDMLKLNEFRIKHYNKPIQENIISLICNINDNSCLNFLEPYNSYIASHYQDQFKLDIIDYYDNQKRELLNSFKEIERSFLSNLIHGKDQQSIEKKQILINFIEQNIYFYREQSFLNPYITIESIAELRNPYVQSKIISDNLIMENLKQYIFTLSQKNLENLLSKFFFYSLNIKTNEYINIWINKKHIHVKFCGKIFDNRYEHSKTYLKTVN